MLNRSIYAIDPKGKFALGMNFERSHFTRAYSYAPIQDEYWNEKIHPEDFIYKIDINSKEEKRLFSINDIIKKNNDVVNDFNAHWFEHIIKHYNLFVLC